MKKILFLLLTAISISATAQQVVSTTVKFNNNVTFNDSTFGNPSKVPVTTFEDTIRYTRGAGNGKLLASDANGNAYWTNSSSIDTFTGTPVFPSGLKTDTIFTTDFNGTGYVMQLVNDTTGVFATAPFWKQTGNAGTTPGTDFIGTTDAQNLVVKTNAVERTNYAANGQYITYASFASNDTMLLSLTNNGLGAGFNAARFQHVTLDGVSGATMIDATSFNKTRNYAVFGFTNFGAGNSFLETMYDSSTQVAALQLQVQVPAGPRYTVRLATDSGFLINTPMQYNDSTQGSGKVLTSDAIGYATWQGSDGLFAVDSVAATGDTTDLAANTYTAIIASGAITDLVLRFPASPSNGDVVVAKFDFAVTTLTSDGQGKTVFGFPSSTALGQHREWRYNATTGAWY